MDTVDPVRFVFAFLFVIALIGVCAALLKRYGNSLITGQTGGKWLAGKNEGGRLAVLECRYIDAKHKLVLIRRDNTEHLLLLGDGWHTVVESEVKNDER